jgi:hypothetical protein
MKKLMVLAAACLTVLALHAQKDKDLPAFGKIDKTDLELKACEFDKDAEAMILMEYGNVEFQRGNHWIFAMKIEKRVRLKIFKEKGLDRASIKLHYYSDDNFEKLLDVDAVTYNLDPSGKITETKVDKKSMYREKVNANISAFKFTFPEVKVGESVLEYRYTIIRETVQLVDPWIFQDRIPTRVSAYRITIPEYFKFTTSTTMSHPVEQKKEEFRQSITLDRENIQFNAHEYFYKMKNVPALKDEPYMGAAKDYLQRVNFQLATVQFPNQLPQNLTNSWSGLTRNLMESAAFGQQIKKNLLKNDAMNAITANARSPFEKMSAIFYHVQKNMAWDGIHDFYCTSVKESYAKKTGSSGDINLILLNLLRDAELDAKPVLTSTRQHGQVMTAFPFMEQFNNVLVLVTIGDNNYVLDASDKASSPGLIPEDVLGTEAYLLDGESGQFITLWTNKNTFRHFITLNGKIDEDGMLTGECNVSSYDYGRIARMRAYKEGKEKLTAKYFNGDQVKLTDIKLENDKESEDSLPLNQYVKFSLPVNSSGEYRFFSPNLFSGFSKNPFTADTRQTHIDFGYNQHYVFTGNITIPDGYEFETPPKSLGMIMPDTSIIFRRYIEVKGNTAGYRITLEFKRPYYDVQEYAEFKEFYKILFDKLGEQFVFKKKA